MPRPVREINAVPLYDAYVFGYPVVIFFGDKVVVNCFDWGCLFHWCGVVGEAL